MDLSTHVHLWCSHEYLKHFTTKRANFERTMRCVSFYSLRNHIGGMFFFLVGMLPGCSWIFFIVSPIFQHCLGFHPPWSWIAWAVSTRTTQRQQLDGVLISSTAVEITIVVRWNVLLFFFGWCAYKYLMSICIWCSHMHVYSLCMFVSHVLWMNYSMSMTQHPMVYDHLPISQPYFLQDLFDELKSASHFGDIVEERGTEAGAGNGCVPWSKLEWYDVYTLYNTIYTYTHLVYI